jgi:hypothetical protein
MFLPRVYFATFVYFVYSYIVHLRCDIRRTISHSLQVVLGNSLLLPLRLVRLISNLTSGGSIICKASRINCGTIEIIIISSQPSCKEAFGEMEIHNKREFKPATMRVNIIRKYIKGHKRSKNRPECGKKQIQFPYGFCPPPSHYFQVAGYNISITAACLFPEDFWMYLYDKMLYWFYDSNSFIPSNA